jgi:hypothetical protein
MKLYKKYKINGNIYKAFRKEKDHYIIQDIKTKLYHKIYFDVKVYSCKHQDYNYNRLNGNEILNFVDYIKNKTSYWYLEDKNYIKFLRNTIIYKLLYRAQKVIARKRIIGLYGGTRYANKYYAYKLKDFIEWFMKNEK